MKLAMLPAYLLEATWAPAYAAGKAFKVLETERRG